MRQTPYDVLSRSVASRRVTKREVLDSCQRLEDHSAEHPPAVVLATVQDMRFAGARAREVWEQVAAHGAQVVVYGRDVPAYVGPGVPGVAIDDDDPLVDVWCYLLLWADGSAAAMAGADVSGLDVTDPGLDTQDLSRDFDLIETDDAALVRSALEAMGVPLPD